MTAIPPPTVTLPSVDRPSAGGLVDVQLLGGFRLLVGGAAVAAPQFVARLLAFLALRRLPQDRLLVASCLWPDVPEERASANLRTTLWKVRRAAEGLVVVDGRLLRLGPRVRVDVDEVTEAARLLLGPDEVELDRWPVRHLDAELLPEWFDEWALFERERFRQLRLHALEALCRRLSAEDRHAEAIDAGMAAVSAEPLRETAHRALIAAYVAEGNQAEAVRHYDRLRGLLAEHGLAEPAVALGELLAG